MSIEICVRTTDRTGHPSSVTIALEDSSNTDRIVLSGGSSRPEACAKAIQQLDRLRFELAPKVEDSSTQRARSLAEALVPLARSRAGRSLVATDAELLTAISGRLAVWTQVAVWDAVIYALRKEERDTSEAERARSDAMGQP